MIRPNNKHRRPIGTEPPKPPLIDLAIVAGAIAVLLLRPTLRVPWVPGPGAADSMTRCSDAATLASQMRRGRLLLKLGPRWLPLMVPGSGARTLAMRLTLSLQGR